MWLLNAEQIKTIIHQLGLLNLMNKTIQQLRLDYSRFPQFHKSPRHAVHHSLGVLELMPCADSSMYSFKYVNGHPNNTSLDKLCVAAFGMLAKQEDGYPLLLCDMTWLTAIRTAATAALIVDLAQPSKHDNCIGLIGTGAQAEFMLLAISQIWPVKTCYFTDIDSKAMQKFKTNMQHLPINLIATEDRQTVCYNADILVTLTAAKQAADLVDFDWLKPGALLCGIGGDTPGKTELNEKVVNNCRIIVEYLKQTKKEGELQNIKDYSNVVSIYDVLNDNVAVREFEDQIVLFDSVGFGLEDFSVLMVLYKWLKQYGSGIEQVDFLPKMNNVKNLYGSLMSGVDLC